MRENFIRTRESFVCLKCGQNVVGDGYTNHCPRCLYSCHVDIVPGDRAETCHGLMIPIAAMLKGGRIILIYRCKQCKRYKRNKASSNDNSDAINKLFGRPIPDLQEQY